MCGRFTITVDPGELQSAFPGIEVPVSGIPPRYNISPSQPVAVIPNDGKNRLDFYSWGLIPSWSKDISIGSKLINARCETLAEKPSFRNAYRRRRCLIPASGFYEWRTVPSSKVKEPIYIYMKNKRPFAFAGLWEIWHSIDGSEIRSCTIITTMANNFIQPIHNRMPVIISPNNYTRWLDPSEVNGTSLTELFNPYPSEEFAYHAVSRLVNSPSYDTPECISTI